MSEKILRDKKYNVDFLCDYACEKIGEDIVAAEIGSFSGESSEVFCRKFSFLYCIDCWNLVYSQNKNSKYFYFEWDVYPNVYWAEKKFIERMSHFDNILKIKDFSHRASLGFESKSLDLVYIDAAHNYNNVVRDIRCWLPKCRFAISGHDYNAIKCPEVAFAVEKELGVPDKVFPDSSWIKFL